MSRTNLVRAAAIAACALAPACITTVDSNERALFYSAGAGMDRSPVGPGWYWHLPWNHYVVYDLRWKQHTEQVHLHTRDGLHLDLELACVVRPTPADIYEVDATVGPDFYNQLVRPAFFAAVRDGGGQFNHLDVATRTHEVEEAIQKAMIEHLKGQHIDVAEVAIQHFDLPPEVEAAANRTAASAQLIAAKKVDLELAQKENDIELEKRRGALDAEGLERKTKAQQDLDAAEQQVKIEETRRQVEREKQEADADAVTLHAKAEAEATIALAEAEKQKMAATTQHLTPAYVRLQAVEALAKAMSGNNTKMIVVPVGANGLPSFFAPFLNPFGTNVFGSGNDTAQ
jgi:regulator of protease activity HflC (stomatin/prohibitin superfamily)